MCVNIVRICICMYHVHSFGDCRLCACPGVNDLCLTLAFYLIPMPFSCVCLCPPPTHVPHYICTWQTHWCRMEAFLISMANLFRAMNSAYLSCSTVLINLLIFPTYTLTTGIPITPTMVFTTLSLVTFVRVLTFSYIVEAVLGIREIKVAVRRMEVHAYIRTSHVHI